MAKEKNIEMHGIVKDAVKDAFMVETEHGHLVHTKLSGKMRTRGIKVVPGDHVRIEVSPYDITRGRIMYRLK